MSDIRGNVTDVPSAKLPRQWKTVRSIGVVGSRGTGKTCYLGATYGARAEMGATLEYQDESTADSLRRVWDILGRASVPEANAVTLPSELNFRLRWRHGSTKRRWSFTTIDYSGEFIQLGESSAKQLKDEVRRWLASCDAVLFFVGLGDPDLLTRLNELNVFISELQRQSGRKGELTIPVGLVLTKWDVQGPIGHDVEEEERRANKFVQTNPEFKQIAETVRNCGDWVHVFPVSAFGGYQGPIGPGMLPPTHGARPFNVLAPLVWAAEQASNIKSARYVRKMKRLAGVAALLVLALSGWYAFDSAKFAKARDLLETGGTPEAIQSACGDYAELVSPFKQITGRKEIIARGLREFNEHTSAMLAYDRCKQEPSAAHEKEFVRLATDFFSQWPDSRYAVKMRDRHAEIMPRLIKRTFDDFLAFREKNPGEENADLRIAQAQELLEKFKDAPQTEQVRLVLAEDEAQAQKYKSSQAVIERLNKALGEAAKLNAEQAYDILAKSRAKEGAISGLNAEAQARLKKFDEQVLEAEQKRDDAWFTTAQSSAKAKPDDPDAIEQAYRGYINKGGKRHVAEAQAELAKMPALRDDLAWADVVKYADQNKNPDSIPIFKLLLEKVTNYRKRYAAGRHANESAEMLTRVNEQFDQFEWNRVEDYIRRNAGSYENHLKELKAYKNRDKPCKYFEEAGRRITETETAWDRTEWNRVREAADAARRNTNATTTKLAFEAANNYLSGVHSKKQRRSSAEAIVYWYESFRNAQDVEIKVIKAEIEKGSDINDGDEAPDCWIEVTLDGKMFRTKKAASSYTPEYNETLGPYRFSRGNKALQVRIVDDDGRFAKDDIAESRPLMDDFVIGLANNVVEFECKKGKKIRVYLKCAKADVPPTPPYE